jgi:PAS fold
LVSSAFLDGGGEMGALMRAIDWTKTPLGPIEGWPQSLRTTVSTCLNSRFPILIWWGPDLVKLYNDAHRELLVEKHPAALGRAGREVWPEIWHIIGPMLESVVKEGRATWSEDQFLPLERRGYPEECYLTFSYSPIHDETGGIGGVFCAVTETTGRVIGERRLRLLQELASHTAAETVNDVCVRAMHVLAGDSADIPFALIYLLDADGRTLHFVASTGSGLIGDLTPATVDLDAGEDDPRGWPFRRALQSGAMVMVEPPAPALRALSERASGVLIKDLQ